MSVNLTFYDRERRFLGFQTLRMPSGGQVDEVLEFPYSAHTCSMTMLGRNVQQFALERLAINDKDVDLQRLSVYKAENEMYVLKKEGSLLTVRISDAYRGDAIFDKVN